MLSTRQSERKRKRERERERDTEQSLREYYRSKQTIERKKKEIPSEQKFQEVNTLKGMVIRASTTDHSSLKDL
jgi:hypothetical protein